MLTDPRRYLREVASWQALGWLARFGAFYFFLEAFRHRRLLLERDAGDERAGGLDRAAVHARRRRRPAGAAGRHPEAGAGRRRCSPTRSASRSRSRSGPRCSASSPSPSSSGPRTGAALIRSAEQDAREREGTGEEPDRRGGGRSARARAGPDLDSATAMAAPRRLGKSSGCARRATRVGPGRDRPRGSSRSGRGRAISRGAAAAQLPLPAERGAVEPVADLDLPARAAAVLDRGERGHPAAGGGQPGLRPRQRAARPIRQRRKSTGSSGAPPGPSAAAGAGASRRTSLPSGKP